VPWPGQSVVGELCVTSKYGPAGAHDRDVGILGNLVIDHQLGSTIDAHRLGRHERCGKSRTMTSKRLKTRRTRPRSVDYHALGWWASHRGSSGQLEPRYGIDACVDLVHWAVH
jgi:hypothetical protein